MAIGMGVDPQKACEAVADFPGVSRRFTERGNFHGAVLIDDYAHLPAEISAAISAARTHPLCSGKVVAVFQPNRFHRIAAMADAYADCFHDADVVVITDVYASGTQRIEGVTGELVVNAIRASHPRAEIVWAPTRADIVTAVAGVLAHGDVCISMGCGDIETFPDDLKEASA
jgi:UDP-N-acetylmuramate--alanine ligase